MTIQAWSNARHEMDITKTSYIGVPNIAAACVFKVLCNLTITIKLLSYERTCCYYIPDRDPVGNATATQLAITRIDNKPIIEHIYAV